MAAISRATLPTGRAGRILALAILLLAFLLVWEAVGSPLLGWFETRSDALDGRRAVAARMQMLAARLPALRRQARADTEQAGPGALIGGSSDAIAGAALQEQVQQMASRLGATLSSSETLAAGKAAVAGYRRVGVRISVSAPFDVMVRLIAAIEQATPAMLIDDLQLHGSRIQLQNAAPLEGAMTVFAFRQDDGSGGGPRGGGNGQSGDADPGDGSGP